MEANLYKTETVTKYPDHWLPFKFMDFSCPTGYISMIQRGHHNFYLQNGGTIKDGRKYQKIVKNLFNSIMDAVLEGKVIEIPFFGELYSGPKNELMFRSIKHEDLRLNSYVAFFKHPQRKKRVLAKKK